MARRTPGNRSITLASQNVIYNLYTLLSAVDSSYTLPKKAQAVSIQVKTATANVYIGEPVACAATDCGAWLVANQVWQAPGSGGDSNLVRLDDIALLSDTNATQLNISWVTR